MAAKNMAGTRGVECLVRPSLLKPQLDKVAPGYNSEQSMEEHDFFTDVRSIAIFCWNLLDIGGSEVSKFLVLWSSNGEMPPPLAMLSVFEAPLIYIASQRFGAETGGSKMVVQQIGRNKTWWYDVWNTSG